RAGINPMMAMDVTVFPEPDSPTRPRVSPRLTWKLTSCTTSTQSRCILNATLRSSTERRASDRSRASVLGLIRATVLGTSGSWPRADRPAQRVADDGEGRDGEGEGDPRWIDEVLQIETMRCLGQHAAPARRGRRHAEPQIAQSG